MNLLHIFKEKIINEKLILKNSLKTWKTFKDENLILDMMHEQPTLKNFYIPKNIIYYNKYIMHMIFLYTKKLLKRDYDIYF